MSTWLRTVFTVCTWKNCLVAPVYIAPGAGDGSTVFRSVDSQGSYFKAPLISMRVGKLLKSTIISEYFNLHNVIKKASLTLFVNKVVGLKMHFIGFQTIYYHADAS